MIQQKDLDILLFAALHSLSRLFRECHVGLQITSRQPDQT
jgi:hypothetical protein